jgi:prepilin signal peptidase PulO-like enzyme (type II secretory pathway)
MLSSVGALLIISALYHSIGFAVVCGLFLWISVIDLYDRIIPDILLVGALLTLWGIGAPAYPISFALATGLIVIKWGLETLYAKTLIGWGDIKLLTLCLTFVPLQSTPILLCVSGVFGVIMALILRSKEFPFAPAIIVGFLSNQG